MKIRWTREATETLKRMNADGHGINAIAAAINYPRLAVEARIRALSIGWTRHRLRQFRSLFNAGAPFHEISERLGLASEQVARTKANQLGWKRELGLALRQIEHPIEARRPDRRAANDLARFKEAFERRNAPDRDLAGRVFGDPPVGYSALEKRA